jgi:peptide/nickel transport system ATP-binding protein
MYAGQVVESGSVHEIFADPRHPYTRGLLGSLPSVEAPGQRLVSIPGTVPNPTAWPAGCRFADRCELAGEGCQEPQPLVMLDGPDRAARCWRAP